MSSIEEILKQMQSSRPMPTKVLYEGELQGNTDQYYRPTRFHNLDNVPKAPRNLFCEYGATTEIDNRPFMTPQPQMPRDPELEGLNEYFNKQRILEYARGVAAQTVGETIAKQAEQAANSFVKDEIDRRAGIRKATLVSAGVSEQDATRQIGEEALSGINKRTIDMRDKQITDAVNMYYNINNLPPPVTQPSANPVRPTLPTGPDDSVPLEAADAPYTAEEDEWDAYGQEELDREAAQAELGKEIEPTDATGGAGYAVPRRNDAGEGEGYPIPEIRPAQPNAAYSMSKQQLVDKILAVPIKILGVTSTQFGQMYGRATLMRYKSQAELQSIVADYIQYGGAGAPEAGEAAPATASASNMPAE